MQKSLFDLHPSVSDQKLFGPGRSPVYSDELNSSQFEAVTAVDGPVMVIAGAGSGKTRTLVYRLAYLVEQGIAPENILLLTFTRKAAREMQDRAANLLDEKCSRVTGGTFHSVANLLLRRYCRYLDYEPNFTILDRNDSEGIINLLKSSLDLAGSGKRFPSKRVVMNILSGAVNKSMAVVDLMDERFSHLLEYLKDIERIHEHYVKFKFEHGLMDYDDLLVNLRRLLAEFPEARDAVSSRFSHIMVDEYQDTNLVQAEIVKLLAHHHDNVMVVGDDAQSIYSFRGANFRNIMDFPRDYKDCTIIKLEENYRSSQAILSVTNEIISLAKEKYTKKLFSNIQKGPAPILHGAVNEERQAGYVAGRIQTMHRKGKPLREMAVLFRSGFHAYKLELELNSRQLPFEKRGGQKLTESAHMKDVLSFLRVLVNPSDYLSWNRILLQLDKVGPKTVQRILRKMKEAGDPVVGLKAYPAAKSWREGFLKLVEFMEELSQTSSPSASFEQAMEYYEPIFERVYHDDYPSRRRDLDQLKDILSGYQDLGSFIDDTALDPPDITPADSGAKDEDRLILSTVHSAKGLEWDTVFIINLAEGKFPSAHAKYNDELEEERRLLYVAATRARENLFFVYPRETIGADRRRAPAALTPLLADLPSHVLQSPVVPGLKATPYHGSEKKKKVRTSAFVPGSMVKHPFFGRGRVIEASGPRSLDVDFSGHGLKTLHLDFAKLEICDS